MNHPIASRSTAWRHLPALTALAAVVLAVLVCVPPLSAPFFTDDVIYISENLLLQSTPLSKPWLFITSRTNPWEVLPVRDLSYALDLALFGLNPVGFRLHNLLLYALCGLACWLAATALSRHQLTNRQSRWLAAITTLLFMVHPAHVESVVWISGRKDLLAGLFSLMTLWLFALSLEPGRRRSAWRLASIALFVLAVFSKGAAVALALMLPLVVALVLLPAGTLPQRLSKCFLPGLPFYFVAAAAVAVHVGIGAETTVLADADSTSPRLHAQGPADMLLIAGHLVRIALLPVNLRLIYVLQDAGRELVLAWLGAFAFCSAVPLALWQVYRRFSIAAAGVLFFVLLALPYIQIIPFHTWSLVSERFLFMPLFGLCLAAAAVLIRIPPHVATAVLILVALLLLGGTSQRAGQWQDPDVLWAGNARLTPSEHRVVEPFIDQLLEDRAYQEAIDAVAGIRSADHRRTLGLYVQARRDADSGDMASAAQLVAEVVSSLRWNPGIFYLKVAALAMSSGVPEQALPLYRTFLVQAPHHAGARYNLGLALKRTGDPQGAAEAILQAVDDGLARSDAWNNLGLAYRDSGRTDAAENAFRQALTREPDHWHAAYNLARLMLVQQRTAEAREQLQEARRRGKAAGADTTAVDELLRTLGDATD